MIVGILFHLVALFFLFLALRGGVARSSLVEYSFYISLTAVFDFLPKWIANGDVWWAAAPLGWVIVYYHAFAISASLSLFLAARIGFGPARRIWDGDS